jgi:hypothetical protein
MGKRYREDGTKQPWRNWTPTQEMCYLRNCNCRGCEVLELLSSERRCMVKKSIIIFIKKFGVPEGLETKGIIDD